MHAFGTVVVAAKVAIDLWGLPDMTRRSPRHFDFPDKARFRSLEAERRVDVISPFGSFVLLLAAMVGVGFICQIEFIGDARPTRSSATRAP